MSPAERRLRARIAAHSMHAQGKTNTKPAREAFLAGFEDAARPASALKAHMLDLSLRSAQARRKGLVAVPAPKPRRRSQAFTPDQRVAAFWAKVDKDGPGGCWLWTAATSAGYGHFWNGALGRMVLAHRFAYELLVGPVPTELQLDHLCRVRLCVNPDHLEAVTYLENQLRSPLTFAGKAAA